MENQEQPKPVEQPKLKPKKLKKPRVKAPAYDMKVKSYWNQGKLNWTDDFDLLKGKYKALEDAIVFKFRDRKSPEVLNITLNLAHDIIVERIADLNRINAVEVLKSIFRHISDDDEMKRARKVKGPRL
jgi:hypothetical protein